MEQHLKHGFIFAVVLTAVLLILNMMAWTGVGWATVISNIVFIPLAWFWETIGVSACQAIGYIVFIILSVPIYYFIIGFLIGTLMSAIFETILMKKEERRYSNQSPKDLNNSSPKRECDECRKS